MFIKVWEYIKNEFNSRDDFKSNVSKLLKKIGFVKIGYICQK